MKNIKAVDSVKILMHLTSILMRDRRIVNHTTLKSEHWLQPHIFLHQHKMSISNFL